MFKTIKLFTKKYINKTTGQEFKAIRLLALNNKEDKVLTLGAKFYIKKEELQDIISKAKDLVFNANIKEIIQTQTPSGNVIKTAIIDKLEAKEDKEFLTKIDNILNEFKNATIKETFE